MKPMVLNERTFRSLGSRDIRLKDGKGAGLKDSDYKNRVSTDLVLGKFF